MLAKTKTKTVKEDEKRLPKVWVVGGGYEYIKMFFQLGCDGAKGLDDADIVCFTGGEDVTPDFYGEAAMARTNYNRVRDELEKAIFDIARDRGIPMVGICRGGQFLNVMNKGKMWQHVTGHVGPHVARIEVPPFIVDKRRTIKVTSTHHQMMIPTDEAIILATALEAFEKHSPALAKLGKEEDIPDIEVVFYDDTNCLCFQPHPEFSSAPPECLDFFEECMENWIYPRVLSKQEKVIVQQSVMKGI